MSAIQNIYVTLYMTAICFFIFVLDRNKGSHHYSRIYRILLVVLISFLLTDSLLWALYDYLMEFSFAYAMLWELSYGLSMAIIVVYFYFIHDFIVETYGIDDKYPLKDFIAGGILLLMLWLMVMWDDDVKFIRAGNVPEHTPFFLLLYIPMLSPVVVSLRATVKAWKKCDNRMRSIILLYILVPTISAIIYLLLQIDTLVYISLTIMTLLIYVTVKQENRMDVFNQLKIIQAKEAELKETEQKVMIGNIQPLFIQGILSSIASMAEKDPKKAEETTSSFATYLRMNLNSVGKNEPVPFEEELKHADSFLALESNVWPGKIKVEHDTEAFNFFLPVLTLQPLVENALVHGILPNDGGTIKIWSREIDDYFLVGIDDDGIGFDATLTHGGVGIEHTRNRLEKVSGGKMEIRSERGKGTSVTIYIPAKTAKTF